MSNPTVITVPNNALDGIDLVASHIGDVHGIKPSDTGSHLLAVHVFAAARALHFKQHGEFLPDNAELEVDISAPAVKQCALRIAELFSNVAAKL